MKSAYWLAGAALIVGMTVTGAAVTPVLAQSNNATRSYDIPASALGSALNRFGRMSGVAISYDGAAIRGKNSNAVRGEYVPARALDILLDGTGLRASPDGAGGFVLTSSGGAGTRQIQEIIVTGEKAERTLQETPSSVAVTTSQTIAAENLIDVYDILQRTPNVAVSGDRTRFSIRGIDAFSVTGGDGALASVYLDGAVLPRTALTIGPLDLYDIAQVEVFRGPQSTVQGRNALAGAVIIRTTDPSWEWNGRARFQMTDKDGGRRIGAAVGGPLVDGQLAFRVAGELARTDGIVRNDIVGSKSDGKKSETARAKLLFTPDAVPGLTVLASYMYDRHERGNSTVEFDAPYNRKDRISTSDVVDNQAVTSHIATLQMDYELGKGFGLTSVTNYSDIRFHSITDQDRSASVGQVGRLTDPEKTFQQEVRLSIDKDWVQGVIGAYYLRDDNRGYHFEATQSTNLTRLGADTRLLEMGLSQANVDTVLGLYGGVVPLRTTINRSRLTKNYAAFTDLVFPIVDGLKLRLGLRYDDERQQRGGDQTMQVTKALPDPATVPFITLRPIVTQLNALILQTAAAANAHEPLQTVKYQAWLPKAGISYDISRDVSLSLTAQRGYRAGGAGMNEQRAEAYQYDPEYTWNYEAALRTEWFDRRLSVNANVYQIDWREQQVAIQLTPGAVFDTRVVNVGKSRLRGIELEVRARPTHMLSLYAGGSHSDTEFLEFNVPAGQSYTGGVGNEFANAPRWTAMAGATWQHPSGLIANINANYRSAVFLDVAKQVTREVPGRTLVNGRLGWQGTHGGLFLNISNIFNVEKPASRFLDFDGRTRGIMTEPRVIGLSLEGRF